MVVLKDYYTGISESKEIAQTELSREMVLECGVGNDYTFEPNSNFLFTPYPCEAYMPKTIGTVSIDTQNLSQPKIKIEFSCNLHLTETHEGIVQLEFQLFRTSNSISEIPLGYWYFKLQVGNHNLAQPFSFVYCDFNVSPASYDYFVKCEPIELEVASICITNCHIAALAQSI